MSVLDYLFGFAKNMAHPLASPLAFVDGASRVSRKARTHRFARVRDSIIGDYSYIGPSTRIVGCDIGKFCSISWNCCIGLESHKISLISTSPIFTDVTNGTGTTWLATQPRVDNLSRTTIGNDVWIGANVLVMKAVKIGDGAVVGAGAVVTKDVDAYSIVAGVPARTIGQRFPDDVISVLLKKKWWDAPEEQLKREISLFQVEYADLDVASRLPHGI